MMNLEKIKKDLQNRLSEYRYVHSVWAAEEAAELAKYYGVDVNLAYLAGLLHDIAKEFSCEEKDKWVREFNLSDELLNTNNLDISHAEVGAIVAEKLYGVDSCISQAIRYHTIGNIKMNMLDKIAFIADKIAREGKNVDELKKLAYQDIDDALIWYLRKCKRKLENKGKIFNEESEKLLEYLLLEKND